MKAPEQRRRLIQHDIYKVTAAESGNLAVNASKNLFGEEGSSINTMKLGKTSGDLAD